MNSKFFYILNVLLLISLAACSSLTPSPTPTEAPTVTFTPVPSETPTPLPTQTPTLLPAIEYGFTPDMEEIL